MRIIQFVLFALLASSSLFAGAPKATALLKGVEQERSKYQCFRMCYTEHRAEEGKTVDQIVDFDHGKIRKEHLPNDLFYGMKGVLLDDVIYTMSTGYNEGDLAIVALNTVNASGAGIYDPRLLGLTDMMSHRHPLREVITAYTNKRWDLQQTTFKGRSMYLLTWKKKNNTDDEEVWKVWVEEPGFRIYRITKVASYGDIILESDYADSNRTPFPTTIKVSRKAGLGKIKNETIFDRTITVTQFEEKKSFPPETFTYAGMNLPLNTAVVDYRIQRRLGYWNGEELVDDPVAISAQELRELMTESEKKTGRPLLAIFLPIGIAFILGVIYLYMRRKNQHEVS
ncbi:hypothetical protein FACS1894170_05690 [Planctomycetales bacterium]|nr:hypothetical protein FACS1894170_05690 [Planctomycetales bacterium]